MTISRGTPVFMSCPQPHETRTADASVASVASGDEPVPPRLLNREAIIEICERIQTHVSSGGETRIRVQAWWHGELRWARNRVSLASDRRGIHVAITRRIQGASVTKGTNQLDDASLLRTIRAIERDTAFVGKRVSEQSMDIPEGDLAYPDPAVWSDDTYNVTATQRGAVARALTEGAEAKAMLSAGYLEMRAYEAMKFNFGDDDTMPPYPATDEKNRDPQREKDSENRRKSRAYWRYTQAQCSMTVRHPQGIGSGWAGSSSFDWKALDAPVLADRALKKCLASLNPVAIEPGRYTVILEPQAVATLMSVLMLYMSREYAESGRSPFTLEMDNSLGLWRSKLGKRVVDERVTISHDPMHPALGILPYDGLRPITWIERGVLKTLSYDRTYALRKLNENLSEESRIDGSGHRPSYHMHGGPTLMDEMIATTKRGVLVTRFSDLDAIDGMSLLVTGLTRDGLWLIEDGKIVKAIRNMRFTDSPLFVLNQLDQLGPAVPVFNPMDYQLAPIIVPALKARDFAFTATIDAL